MPDDMTTPAAAAYMGVHTDTLARWSDEGKVPFWRTPGGQRRFLRADLDALRQTTTATAEADAS